MLNFILALPFSEHMFVYSLMLISQSEGYQQVDRRAESLIFCHGCAVQALFNFLINCRSCIAMTGPQAGIPPTILSPTCFRGATIQSNKVSACTPMDILFIFRRDMACVQIRVGTLSFNCFTFNNNCTYFVVVGIVIIVQTDNMGHRSMFNLFFLPFL